MSAFGRSLATARSVGARTPFASSAFSASSRGGYGRTAAYRRLQSTASDNGASSRTWTSSGQQIEQSWSVALPHLRSRIRAEDVLSRTAASYARHFSAGSGLRQEPKGDASGQKATDGKEAPGAAQSQTSDQEPKSESEASKEKSESESESESSEKKAEGEEGEGESKDKKSDKPPPPPPPHGSKTPWQVFTETLSTEFKASKEWNESTKQLASGYQEFTQNENIKKARKAYSSATNTATSTTSAALKSTGKVIGQGAAWTWDTGLVRGVRKGANAAGRGIEKVTRPVRETEAYKNVKDVIDDGSSSRYGGWVEKEERRKQREMREAKELASGKRPMKLEEDPDAGTNVTLHKDAAWKEQWRSFRDSSRLMQGVFKFKETYKESENPIITTARDISDRVAGFFAENETAMVIKKFREMDPHFQIEPFLQEVREYMLPEVLDAYVKGDVETLQLWLSAAQYEVYAALMRQYTTAGLKSDGRILDIRNVDILSARLLDPGDIPVFVLTCRTQEVHVYRNAKTNELAAGMDDKVQQVTYAIGMTRIPEDVSNPETRGWRLIELQKQARDYL